MDGPYRDVVPEPGEDNPELVVVRTFDAPHEAALVASYLENEGIQTFLANDVLLNMNPFWNMAMGGVKLRVRADQAADADYLVARYERRRTTPTRKSKSRGRQARAEARATARRALSLAIFGVFLCPGAAHIGALLLAASVDVKLLDRRARHQRTAALGISLAVVALAVAALMVRW